MNQINDIIITSAFSILTILSSLLFKEVKKYLLAKGGQQAVRIVEIVAQNAVRAVEQMAKDTDIKGQEKFDIARHKVESALTRSGITLTDGQLETFIESAVKSMNDGWKE